MASTQVDLAECEAWRDSLSRSHARRAGRARELRRRLRVRGGLASLAAVAVLTAAAGGGIAVGASSGERGAAHAEQTSRTLKIGDRGRDVAALQRKLRIPADGVFGRRTRAAVKRFQRRRGLTVDGIAGPQTLAALGLATSATPRRRSGGPRLTASERRTLARIARCESGGNPRAVSPDGRYRGKYQFTRETWRSVGGRGDPARASEAEQDRRAAILLRREGTAPWGSCA